jgi:hypothetical protein
MEPTTPRQSPTTDFGLPRGILSPMETLAQSVSTMAPTTTPAATIPLVCALAGNGTWLASSPQSPFFLSLYVLRASPATRALRVPFIPTRP